jgi:50S ribosomal protein uL3
MASSEPRKSAGLGMIGRKLGMTQVFLKGGARVPVTVIQAGPCTVVQKRTQEKDGYSAVQLGYGEIKAQRLTKAGREHRKKAGRMVAVLREFASGTELEVGAEVKVVDLFKEGDLVDVTGVTKGRGYQGVIKRHHFSGFPATHGTHEYFRHAPRTGFQEQANGGPDGSGARYHAESRGGRGPRRRKRAVGPRRGAGWTQRPAVHPPGGEGARGEP